MLELDLLGRSLGLWLLEISLWTAAVFVLARSLDAGTRRFSSPRVRLLFYAAVLIRLALPLDFTSPVGLLAESAVTVERPSSVAITADEASHEAAAAVLGEPRIETTNVAGEVVEHEIVVVAASSIRPPIGVAILLIYGLGVVVCVSVWSLHGRRIARLIAESKPVARTNRFELRKHPFAGPFAHGLLHRVIVIPARLHGQLQPRLLRRLLAHERAHHQHGDPWLIVLLMAIATIAWPVVPVWLTLRRVRELIEQAADERALRGASVELRRAYGRALVELADGSAPFPALGAYGELESRITALIQPVRTPRGLQLGLALVLTCVIAACMAPGEGEPAASEVAIDRCDELVVAATVQHDDAEKGDGSFDRAIAAYRIYLDECPHHPDFASLLYYAGEAHWARAHQSRDQQDFRQAAELFSQALDHAGKYQLDAAHGQWLSTLHAVGWSDDRPAPSCVDNCEGFPKLPYDADEQAVIESWTRYVAVVGQPLADRANDQLRMARLFMQHNDFAAARPELETLVRQPEQEPAARAAEMFADLLTIAWVDQRLTSAERLRHGDELEAWLREFERAPFFQRDDAERLREATPVLLAGVEWKRAVADMAAGEAGEADGYRRCAERFETLVVTYPAHPQIDELERNATLCRSRQSANRTE